MYNPCLAVVLVDDNNNSYKNITINMVTKAQKLPYAHAFQYLVGPVVVYYRGGTSVSQLVFILLQYVFE